jgi:hypothetical protein
VEQCDSRMEAWTMSAQNGGMERTDQKKYASFKEWSSTKKIDYVAFCLFNLSYVAFNLFYFAYYN